MSNIKRYKDFNKQNESMDIDYYENIKNQVEDILLELEDKGFLTMVVLRKPTPKYLSPGEYFYSIHITIEKERGSWINQSEGRIGFEWSEVKETLLRIFEYTHEFNKGVDRPFRMFSNFRIFSNNSEIGSGINSEEDFSKYDNYWKEGYKFDNMKIRIRF